MIYEAWISQTSEGFEVCYQKETEETHIYHRTKDFTEAVDYARLVQKMMDAFRDVAAVL